MPAFGLDKNRARIFQLFLYSESLRFSEILRKSRIPSSLLAYFLKSMVSEGVLEKSSGFYSLSADSDKLIPFFVPDSSRVNPLVVLLIACVGSGKVLLSKREKRPFKSFLSLPSGRLLISESIGEAAERIMSEKYSLKVSFKNVNAVVFERRFEKAGLKHGFVFFLATVCPSPGSRVPSFLKWISIARLPKRGVIASDYWMIKNKLGSRVDVVEEQIEEFGKSTRMRLL